MEEEKKLVWRVYLNYLFNFMMGASNMNFDWLLIFYFQITSTILSAIGMKIFHEKYILQSDKIFLVRKEKVLIFL